MEKRRPTIVIKTKMDAWVCKVWENGRHIVGGLVYDR